ncbi:MAG: DUF3341 domain-containing protein [Ardenticatenaceae bacterium]|nr:DUF3341 domain-containing protein [Ardenticatenaceae bacterium]MCB8987810.1 DUF3341 domain-containing protein [Ardenticatenaceae bacterium]
MAEFAEADALKTAAAAARDAGYEQMDAYSPLPVEGLPQILGMHHRRMYWIVLVGLITGGVLGFGMQFYASVIDYPLNIGGRPLNSWPSFVPITFELAVLVAAFAAILGMFALNGLPQPYHPVFNVRAFKEASRECFFLCIQASDDQFDLEDTRWFLQNLPSVKGVYDVEP